MMVVVPCEMPRKVFFIAILWRRWIVVVHTLDESPGVVYG